MRAIQALHVGFSRELATGLSAMGVDIVHHLLLTAAMCLVSAWLGLTLLRAERAADPVRR